jgi:hypothetical protein
MKPRVGGSSLFSVEQIPLSRPRAAAVEAQEILKKKLATDAIFGERDRLGRFGRRPAGQSHARERVTVWRALA